MMDIVDELQELNSMNTPNEIYNIAYSAADEIERLRDDLKHSDEIRQSALQSLLSAEKEIERLREAIKTQANAVKTMHSLETTEINRLRKTEHEAHLATTTLDSERQANAILTDENERLRDVLKMWVTFWEADSDEDFLDPDLAEAAMISTYKVLGLK